MLTYEYVEGIEEWTLASTETLLSMKHVKVNIQIPGYRNDVYFLCKYQFILYYMIQYLVNKILFAVNFSMLSSDVQVVLSLSLLSSDYGNHCYILNIFFKSVSYKVEMMSLLIHSICLFFCFSHITVYCLCWHSLCILTCVFKVSEHLFSR